MTPALDNPAASDTPLTFRELKWSGNTAYLRVRNVLRHWRTFHALPPLTALRPHTTAVPIVTVDANDAPPRPNTTHDHAIVVADYRQLPDLLRAHRPPHCFTTPNTLEDYYTYIEPCGALAQSIAVITPATHPGVAELLRGPRARLVVADPTLAGLERYALLANDIEPASSLAATIARALGPQADTAASQPASSRPAAPPASLAAHLPPRTDVAPLREPLDRLADTFEQCLTDIVQVYERIGHDWYHVLHQPGSEAQRSAEHARYFQALDAVIAGLVGTIPPPFHRVLAIETECLQRERAAATQLTGFLYVQSAIMIGYLRWFEGAMTWLHLLRADLQPLRDAP